MNDTKELYYYTSSDTMRFILTKGDIFATNLKYMNDGEEYTNGLSELRAVLNEIYKGKGEIEEAAYEDAINRQPKVYSISFSRERDLLSQWSMYAKESGVSLLMDFSKDKDGAVYEIPRNDKRAGAKEVKTVPRRVYYLTRQAMKEGEYRRVSQEIIEDIGKEKTVVRKAVLDDIHDGIDVIWRELAPYVKRQEFFQEAEYRMIFTLNSLEAGDAKRDDSSIRIDYRVQDSVLKPYLDITRKGGWPVKEIMVGPGFNQKTVYDSVMHFMENARLCIPGYSLKEIKENGFSFLKRLNKRFDGGVCLEAEWKRTLGREKKGADIADSFNRFIAEKRKEWDRQGIFQGKLLANVYMTDRGIILSMSETPYIY